MDTHPAFAEFAQLPRWVCWRQEERDGKSTKIPYQTNGSKASPTDPKTWRALSQVLPFADRYSGVGVVLGELGNGRWLFGIDIDACLLDDGLAP